MKFSLAFFLKVNAHSVDTAQAFENSPNDINIQEPMQGQANHVDSWTDNCYTMYS